MIQTEWIHLCFQRQISWRDASSFAAVCFMVSSSIPLLETRKSWYKTMSEDQRKMIDRLKNLSCYRLSQGGSQFKDIKNHFEELIKVDRCRERK